MISKFTSENVAGWSGFVVCRIRIMDSGRAADREMRFICLFLNSDNRIHHIYLILVTNLRTVFNKISKKM